MKSKINFYIVGIVILVTIAAFYFVTKLANSNKLPDIVINGIENFHPNHSSEETYLLYYPSET